MDKIKKAWADLLCSFRNWRLFYLIGTSEIQKRYKRSSFGQMWITLSMLINVLALGIVWSYLFKMEVKNYLPFIACSMIIWSFISSCISDSASLFQSSERYLKELSLSKITYLNALLLKNFTIFMHNIVIIAIVYVFYGISISLWHFLEFIVGLIITFFFLFGISLIIGILGLRFRDIPNIIASIIQIFFYITPVIWKPNSIPQNVMELLLYNPLAILMSITRDPLYGLETQEKVWYFAIGMTLFILLASFLFFAKYRHRITYWL